MAEIKCSVCGSTEFDMTGEHWMCLYCRTMLERPASQAKKGAVVDFSDSAKGKNASRLLERANLLWEAGQTAQARKLYGQILEIDPTNKVALDRTED